MAISSLIRSRLKGDLLEAHVCRGSCTCDPCTCNPCNCASGRADDWPEGPLWRLTGLHIAKGQFDTTDVSRLTIVKLALTSGKELADDWQEYLLISRTASSQQVSALLKLLERHLLPGSLQPADIALPTFQAPLTYLKKNSERARLHLRFLPEECISVANISQIPDRSWTYQRHVALQPFFS